MFMFRTSVPTERRKDPTTSYPASIVTILTQPASKPTSLTGVSFFYEYADFVLASYLARFTLEITYLNFTIFFLEFRVYRFGV